MPKKTIGFHTLLEFTRQNLKIMTALGTVLVSIIGFFVSPLKDELFHEIWAEKVSIDLAYEPSVREGDVFTIIAILTPTGNVGFSSGTLIFNFDESLAYTDHTPLLIDASDQVVKAPAVNIHALRAGVLTVDAVFKTKYGTYSSPKYLIEIRKASQSSDVSLGNFTGVWNITLDGQNGKMDLVEENGQFAGHYYIFDVHQKTYLSGYRDGSVFRVDLFRNETTKWSVQAQWKRVGDFIQVEGSATLMAIEGGNWVPKSEPKPFTASATLSKVGVN